MGNVIARHWERNKENKESKNVACLLCPNQCSIKDNCTGACGVRKNVDGELIASGYGLVSSIALDHIEKKPLYEYYSGSRVLSVGSFGCNLHCPFCQNYTISMKRESSGLEKITPEELTALAVQSTGAGNIGVAFTYNEPLVGYEFVKDSSITNRKAGLKNILVTNGYINEEPLEELLPYIDAANIDIKGGMERTYKTIGGTLNSVQTAIKLANSSCHVELTTLVIPGENEDEIEEIAKWIASVDKNIPYHLSRFFPRYKYNDRTPTPHETMHKLADIAKQYLNKVYLGNM